MNLGYKCHSEITKPPREFMKHAIFNKKGDSLRGCEFGFKCASEIVELLREFMQHVTKKGIRYENESPFNLILMVVRR